MNNSAYNFDEEICRIGTSSIKWDRRKGKFQDDVLPLWIADTDFSCPPQVAETIRKRCEHEIFGYSFAPEAFHKSIMDWFLTRHQVMIDKSWIRPCCGVVTSISYSIQALTEPGDKIVIQPPVYDPFQAVINGTGRTVVENPLIFRDNTYAMDYEGLEAAFQTGVKMMVLCNPHNPVGRVWTREELSRLTELCVKYQVYLVSDEIHCDIELFDHHYTSVLAFPEIQPLAVVCAAPGKTFNISGLGVSAMLIPNSELNGKIFSKLRTAWLLNPANLSMDASAAAYTYGASWLDEQLAYLEENSRLVQERLAKEAPHIVPAKHEGTFLMWLNFNDFGLSDPELADELIHTWHLGMNSGSAFGTGGSGFMRLNIGCTKKLLNEALDRLIAMHQAHFK